MKVLLLDTKVAIFYFFIVSQIDPSPSSFSLTNSSYFVCPISLVCRKRSAASVGRIFSVKILQTLSCASNVTSRSLKTWLSLMQLVSIFAFFDPVSWRCSSLFLDWFSLIQKVSQKLLTIFPILPAIRKYLLSVTSEFAISLIPPITFNARLSCSIPWSLRIAVNGIPDLFTENPQHITEPKCFRLFLSVHTFVLNKQGLCVHSSAYQK